MDKKLSAGDLISRAIQLVQDNPKITSTWCVVGLLTELAVLPYEGFATARDFLLFFPAIAVSSALYYFIAARFMAAAGHPADKSNVLAYLGAGLLYSLAIAIGFLFVIIPGIILWVRLSLYVPILLAEGKPVIDLGSASWERTSGRTSEILLAHLPPFLMLVPIWLLSITTSSPGAGFDVLLALTSSLAGAYWFCLSIALYERLPEKERQDTQQPI